MANTSPYRQDGDIKASFFREAATGMDKIHAALLDWRAKYASLMRVELSAKGVQGEIDIIRQVIAQIEIDQAGDAKLRKAREKDLLSKGFPVKKSPFEKAYLKNKQKPK